MIKTKFLTISLALFLVFHNSYTQVHPGLILTKEGVSEIKSNLSSAPLFQVSLENAKNEVEAFMNDGVLVPIPKDMAGGYTHEVHKRNFLLLPKTAALYQFTGEKKYADFVKEVFMEYARVFPTYDQHPATRSYAPGKIFWQCLNDANWLVYMSQAYDAVYNYIEKDDRAFLERELFIPLCDHVSLKNPRFFNRIHNHSTWGNAGVGMMALAMDDDELLQRALYGLDDANISSDAMDNDGGKIKLEGQKEAGFFAQLDHSFSPDGYYSEGPYYQRYAMSPFITFGLALDNKKPELEIFKYRDNLLQKALYTLLNLTDDKGQFYPINDSQKGMSFHSRELVAAVDVIYSKCGKDAWLLDVAKKQNKVQLDYTGFEVAKAIAEGNDKPFIKKSKLFLDGANGAQGGVAVLRSQSPDKEFNLIFKFASQGMGHGHFDRLGYSYYNGNSEILQDYSSARWVNIDQKSGGGYLPENKSWAKQTLAHNTVVVNEESHFKGNTQSGSKCLSEPYHFDFEDENFQFASAKDKNAYEGIELHRTLILMKDDQYKNPILIDIFKLQSEKENTIDLPFHFATQFLESSEELVGPGGQLSTLGKSNGYEHVWKEAETNIKGSNFFVTWYTDRKFYTTTSLSEEDDKLFLARIGANDPNFNLRRDAFYVHRKENSKDALFANVILSHGSYSPVDEIPRNPYAKTVKIEKILDSQEYTIVKVLLGDHTYGIMIANLDNKKSSEHFVGVEGLKWSWKGPIKIKKIENEKSNK